MKELIAGLFAIVLVAATMVIVIGLFLVALLLIDEIRDNTTFEKMKDIFLSLRNRK